MAVFSFLLGSMIGLACALIGWLVYDMSLFAGIGLYLSTSILVGMALVLTTVHAHDNTGHEVGA
ncbi:hypothetical protein SAMN04488078_104241 [Antarctobacter heliothermus]|uniref:Uncharacterized protein n=2 Tax=Antarctobacter heliothermus TaxID=74033 RepID=A0A239IGK0_9RHOB|nr:hypothetical protein SAMN04488078_104241 [Antarctobacter heliothermus]